AALCQAQGWATGPTAHVEDRGRGAQGQPVQEAVLLPTREPALLADILPEGLGPDLGVEGGGEVAVVGAIGVDRGGPGSFRLRCCPLRAHGCCAPRSALARRSIGSPRRPPAPG